jgi:hypothetical protein
LEVTKDRTAEVTLTRHILTMKDRAIAPNTFRRLSSPDWRTHAKPGSRKTNIARGNPMKFITGDHFRPN